eukprot:2456519-Pyramimonas_sp.AAC.1
MMLQYTDACDDSELVLAALILIDSVHPEDGQRHVWYSRGRWRQALARAISMRGQAPPPPGGGLQVAGLQPVHTAMRNIIGQPALGNEPEPATVPPTPGQPSDGQTLVQQGSLPVPAGPMTV